MKQILNLIIDKNLMNENICIYVTWWLILMNMLINYKTMYCIQLRYVYKKNHRAMYCFWLVLLITQQMLKFYTVTLLFSEQWEITLTLILRLNKLKTFLMQEITTLVPLIIKQCLKKDWNQKIQSKSQAFMKWNLAIHVYWYWQLTKW